MKRRSARRPVPRGEADDLRVGRASDRPVHAARQGWFFLQRLGQGRRRLETTRGPSAEQDHLGSRSSTWRRTSTSPGESTYRQEYCCSFEAVEGLVYPDLARCIVPGPAPALKRRSGGIDFGYRNPFAAVWGGLDSDGVRWLTHERYACEEPVSVHAGRLPRNFVRYADPHGANEIAELRLAGLAVRRARLPFANGYHKHVQTRIRTGTLRIEGLHPNLLLEAGLYRWDDTPEDRRSEEPVEGYDHALDALRYLISRLDERRAPTGTPSPRAKGDTDPGAAPPTSKPHSWLRYSNEELWTTLTPR